MSTILMHTYHILLSFVSNSAVIRIKRDTLWPLPDFIDSILATTCNARGHDTSTSFKWSYFIW